MLCKITCMSSENLGAKCRDLASSACALSSDRTVRAIYVWGDLDEAEVDVVEPSTYVHPIDRFEADVEPSERLAHEVGFAVDRDAPDLGYLSKMEEAGIEVPQRPESTTFLYLIDLSRSLAAQSIKESNVVEDLAPPIESS